MPVDRHTDAASVRITRARPDEIVIAAKRPVRGGVGVGVLFVATSLLPFAGDQLTPLNWATFAVCALIGFGLIVFNWPRTTRVRIRPSQRVITGAGNPIAFDDVLELELTGTAESEEETPELSYQVVLSARAGRKLVLLAGRDPGGVLADLGELAKVCEFTVRPGWGLAEGISPWLSRAPRDATPRGKREPERRTLMLEEHNPALPGGITALIGGVGVGAMWSVDLYRRAQTGLPLSGLSMTLALVFTLVLILLGLALVSYRLVLHVGEEVVLERRVLGLRRKLFRVPRAELVTAHAVGPSGGDPWHVVLETVSGPQSIPVKPAAAAEVLQELNRGQ